MARRRDVLLGTILVLLTACGGEPPEKEMQQAQGAIDAARAAGASQYAPDEFKAAVTALDHARQAADARDYRQALNDALDSRERAQEAARQSAENMAAARVDADRAIAAAASLLTTHRKRATELEAARVPARTLAESREQLAAAETRLQEARAAFDRQDYPGAKATAEATSQALATLGHALEALASPAPRRGR